MEYILVVIAIALLLILVKQYQTMATLQELQDAVAALQTKVDEEQAQIAELLATNANVIQGLNEQIAALQEQLANSPNPEQIQAVIDSLNAIKADVASTVPPTE